MKPHCQLYDVFEWKKYHVKCNPLGGILFVKNIKNLYRMRNLQIFPEHDMIESFRRY